MPTLRVSEARARALQCAPRQYELSNRAQGRLEEFAECQACPLSRAPQCRSRNLGPLTRRIEPYRRLRLKDRARRDTIASEIRARPKLLVRLKTCAERGKWRRAERRRPLGDSCR